MSQYPSAARVCIALALFVASHLLSFSAAADGYFYDADSPPVAHPPGGYHTGGEPPATSAGWTVDKTSANGVARASYETNEIDFYQSWPSDFGGISKYLYIDARSSARLNYQRTDVPGVDESWTFSARVRVRNPNTPLDSNTVAHIDYHDKRFIMEFGADASGDTLIRVQQDANKVHTVDSFTFVSALLHPVTTPGTVFVTVAMVYNAEEGTADVFVDDREVFSGLVAIDVDLPNRVVFGDNQTAGGPSPSEWRQVLYTVGPQACRDGIDNDGDGRIDFDGGDADCSAANDPTEGGSLNNTAQIVEYLQGEDQDASASGATGTLAVAAGDGHTIELKSNGRLVAWGKNSLNQASPPKDHGYIAIAAGSKHSLALKHDGSVVGWGNPADGLDTPPTEAEFAAISAGTNHNLALKRDGTAIGWGNNSEGQIDVPQGTTFLALAAGHQYSLGLTTDYSIVCWGVATMCDDHPPPEGNDFIAIAAGETHAIALKSPSLGTFGSSYITWGTVYVDSPTNPYHENIVPVGTAGNIHGHQFFGGGPYRAISAGKDYSLLVTTRGELRLWSTRFDINADGSTGSYFPGEAEFIDAAAGRDHAVGIRTLWDKPPLIVDCQGSDVITLTVSAETQFNEALACYNKMSGGTLSINLSEDLISLNAPTTVVNNSTDANLVINGPYPGTRPVASFGQQTVNGGNWVLSAAGQNRLLTIVDGNVTINRVTFISGKVDTPESLVDGINGNGGGAIANDGDLSIEKSTFELNEARNSNNQDELIYGGAIFNRGSLDITESTFSDNHSESHGGAIFNSGTAIIANSTISGNQTGIQGLGGGVYNTGGTSTIINSTLAFNGSKFSGTQVFVNVGELILNNSIITDDQPPCHATGGGTITANSFNLANDVCADATVSSNINLGPLQYNGFVTDTHQLLLGSDAINAGDNTVCAADPVGNLDQQRASRLVGGICDIGAIEAQGPIIEASFEVVLNEGLLSVFDLDAIREGEPQADQGITYSLSMAEGGGIDNAVFVIDPDTGALSFATEPEYVAPADHDMDNTYMVQVNVEDDDGNNRLVSLTINVQNASGNDCSLARSHIVAQTGLWYLLSLPCRAPTFSTFSDLFGEDYTPNATPDWAAFTYDPVAETYNPLSANSPIPTPGVGFWFISLRPIGLYMPFGSARTQTVTDGPKENVCLQAPCYQQTINQATQWNMLGNPSNSNILYDGILLNNESTDCRDMFPCTHKETEQNGILSIMWVWNTATGEYRRLYDLDGTQKVLKPWDGFWFLSLAENGETPETPWQVHLKPYPSQFVFLTDNKYTGDLGGWDDVHDAICTTEAQEGGLWGHYNAWVSYQLGDREIFQPFDTLSPTTTPYILLDGSLVANDFEDLMTREDLANPINITATGRSLPVDQLVWSNTSSNGSTYLQGANWSCDGWTSDATNSFGIVGNVSSYTDEAWTNIGSVSCDNDLRLYCFRRSPFEW